ncbi:MAG TPA: MBL fold metallo-hydrolase [Candidatus Limnocylindrales bacterium]|nr:MBL fold metallo-hydrolase [Candidatus Limnocylindrales bacterium]
MSSRWAEVGDRVFVRRYAFYDQDITAVLSGDAALVVDTRSTPAQAREILDDLRDLGSPRVGIVVNTHGHYDHAFGNSVFRPATIWGHERCRSMIRLTGETARATLATDVPALAAELAEVVLDPPDRVFTGTAILDLGGREVHLAYLGRGHTDNDIVVSIPDADVLCAGDLVENGATPYFGDGFPMDWPATAEALRAMTGPATVVVPGHGDPAGRAFVEGQLAAFRAIAALATRVHARELDLAAAIAAAPYPAAAAREPLERALAQLRGELLG